MCEGIADSVFNINKPVGSNISSKSNCDHRNFDIVQ
jgi:hypothetical protein